MVAILEPFIDTIIICSLTGLVLLSSGVWNEKHINEFQNADMLILSRIYDEQNKSDVDQLFHYLNHDGAVETFTGTLIVEDGAVTNDISIIHARSLAEDITIMKGGDVYTGEIEVDEGVLLDPSGDYKLTGRSLVHSAPLTTIAFTRSYLGDYGQYIVSIGLLLFAFSTAISWSYYGDRAMTFLFGSGSVVYYRIVYVSGFFVASFVDTTIIWTFSGITIALMTIPNLIGILFLRKDMKATVKKYWKDFAEEHPEEKVLN